MSEKRKKEILTKERIGDDFTVMFNEWSSKLIKGFILYGVLAATNAVPLLMLAITNFQAAALLSFTSISSTMAIGNVVAIFYYYCRELYALYQCRAAILSGNYEVSSQTPVKVTGRDRRWLHLALMIFSWPAIVFFFLVPKQCVFLFGRFEKYRVPMCTHYATSEMYRTNDVGLTHFTNDRFYVVSYGSSKKKIISVYNQGLYEYNEDKATEEA